MPLQPQNTIHYSSFARFQELTFDGVTHLLTISMRKWNVIFHYWPLLQSECTDDIQHFTVRMMRAFVCSRYIVFVLMAPLICKKKTFQLPYELIVRSQSSIVSIATGKLRGRSSSPGKIKNFLFKSSRLALGSTQPPIQWVPGTISLGLKRPVREADHSPPTSAEVKKMWIYTSTPPYAFMA
jgi:hypothetical protein